MRKGNMSKGFMIMGTVMIILGIIMFLTARLEIVTNTRYTWSRPYTGYELNIIIIEWCGILAIIFGIMDLVSVLLSKKYTSKTISDVDDFSVSVKKCPNCGISLDSQTKICPKCKNKMQ